MPSSSSRRRRRWPCVSTSSRIGRPGCCAHRVQHRRAPAPAPARRRSAHGRWCRSPRASGRRACRAAQEVAVALDVVALREQLASKVFQSITASCRALAAAREQRRRRRASGTCSARRCPARARCRRLGASRRSRARRAGEQRVLGLERLRASADAAGVERIDAAPRRGRPRSSSSTSTSQSPHQVAVLAAGGAPDQRAVVRVELLDAVRRSRSPPGPDIASRPSSLITTVSAAARDDAHAAEAAVRAADQHHHRDAGRAHVEQRAHHFRHRDQAGVRLVQAHAARFGSSSTASGRSRSARCSRPTSLAPCTSPTAAAHEAAFLRGDEAPAARRACRGRSRRRRRTTHGTPSCARCGLVTRSRRRQDLVERSGVEQLADALARRCIRHSCVHAGAHPLARAAQPPGRGAGSRRPAWRPCR